MYKKLLLCAFLSGIAFNTHGSDSMQKERILQAKIKRQQQNLMHIMNMHRAAYVSGLVTTHSQPAPHVQSHMTVYNQNLKMHSSAGLNSSDASLL